jgi:hypothetical protein
MNPPAPTPPGLPGSASPAGPDLSTELLVLPDGRILVHNLTPVFADLLNELNPAEETIRLRASEPRTKDPQTPIARDELRPGT